MYESPPQTVKRYKTISTPQKPARATRRLFETPATPVRGRRVESKGVREPRVESEIVVRYPTATDKQRYVFRDEQRFALKNLHKIGQGTFGEVYSFENPYYSSLGVSASPTATVSTSTTSATSTQRMPIFSSYLGGPQDIKYMTSVGEPRTLVYKTNNPIRFSKRQEDDELKAWSTLTEKCGSPRHVLPLLGSWSSPGSGYTYYTMPQCEYNLDDFLKDPDTDKALVKWMFRDMIIALSCIHEQGYIHRDLRPANILFCPSLGRESIWQLADFSVTAKPEDLKDADAVGERYYTGPEANDPEKGYQLSTDIYALGQLMKQIDPILKEIRFYKDKETYSQFLRLYDAMTNIDFSKRPSAQDILAFYEKNI